jgi:23S rRNA pseudouridine2605 synthase
MKPMPAERLQKLLARAGVGSRRACEDIITAGRVMVDGRVVTKLGTKADPQTQDVRLDGSRLHPERPEYWLLNKPKGVVCTNLDPAGRSRPVDLMQHYTQTRLFPVGRLDADSKGLLLMTNDGLFANRLTHPRYEVSKTYVATVAGDVTPDDLRRLRRGVWLAEGRTRPAQVRVVRRGRTRSTLEVTIREGRNRQIRRTLARLGHNVWELVRTRIGRLSLRGVGAGHARPLTPDEVEYLKKLPDTPPEAVERPYASRDRPPSPPAGRRAALMAAKGRRAGPAPAAAAPPGGEAPPRRPFDPGERRPSFTRRGRGREGAGRPPRGERRPFRGGDRGREGTARPPRGERSPFGGEHSPFGGGRDRGPAGPDGYKRDSYREKRSRRQHDTDGVGQGRAGDRGHAGRGGGRERGRRDRPPVDGRRPHRRPPE